MPVKAPRSIAGLNNQRVLAVGCDEHAQTKRVTMKKNICLVAISSVASFAFAQSATVTLNPSATSVAAGGTVTVVASVLPDTGSAGSGVFGPAGLYGFGGEIRVSGERAAEVSGVSASIVADLPSGDTVATNVGDAVVRAGAGRGLSDALPAVATDLLSFEIAVANDAADGDFVLDLDGVVVLVENDALVSYATDPGMNQSILAVSSVTITIGQAGCNGADVAEPFGVLDLGDVDGFIAAFLAGGDAADIAAPFGVIDLADIDSFIASFLAGCP